MSECGDHRDLGPLEGSELRGFHRRDLLILDYSDGRGEQAGSTGGPGLALELTFRAECVMRVNMECEHQDNVITTLYK